MHLHLIIWRVQWVCDVMFCILSDEELVWVQVLSWFVPITSHIDWFGKSHVSQWWVCGLKIREVGRQVWISLWWSERKQLRVKLHNSIVKQKSSLDRSVITWGIVWLPSDRLTTRLLCMLSKNAGISCNPFYRISVCGRKWMGALFAVWRGCYCIPAATEMDYSEIWDVKNDP